MDKTSQIYNLVTTGKYYFLSRPRRFGKSLLVSTMEAYFSGRKDLFTGLSIEKLEQDWISYPVLHIDLSGVSYDTEEILQNVLNEKLSEFEVRYGSEKTSEVIGLRFQRVIEAAYRRTGRQVVILIDEYDKPIIDNLGNELILSRFGSTLQGFYSVMKTMDSRLRFGFLTGVTKIGKLSVFSGLNNLNDISMDATYTDICGITEEELRTYFDESVAALASANGLEKVECYGKLKTMYDGYHFCENTDGIYNPFSLLNTFLKRTFNQYWFATGTPTFLVKLMRESSYDITRLTEEEADSSLLSSIDTVFENPVPVLFQSGYLTIKGYDAEFGLYRLGFPNQEVESGFLTFISQYYIPSRSMTLPPIIARLVRSARSGQPEAFTQTLSSLFANTSYQIQGDAEKDFQYAMYIIMELLGEYVQVERTTSNGRIDLLIQTKDYIYIFELKVNADASEALRQIEDKGYARPFASDSRRLFKVGVSFSTATRRIEEWKIC